MTILHEDPDMGLVITSLGVRKSPPPKRKPHAVSTFRAVLREVLGNMGPEELVRVESRVPPQRISNIVNYEAPKLGMRFVVRTDEGGGIVIWREKG